jgi:hypothetical protein
LAPRRAPNQPPIVKSRFAFILETRGPTLAHETYLAGATFVGGRRTL